MSDPEPKPRRQTFRLDLPASLDRAIAALSRVGGACRIVGGSIRDALLGLQPMDFDIEVYGLTLESVADTLRSIGKTNLVGKSFCVVKLHADRREYDFAIPRRERKSGSGHLGFEIEADPQLSERTALSRRDFTINALLYDPNRSELLDYFGGIEDLEKRRLRHVSEAFREDPLRPLRGMQFAGRFNLDIAPETAAICASMKDEYATLPTERIWGEWDKWSAQSTAPSSGLRVLERTEWLRFYPELHALLGVPQDPEWHPEGDVWEHTLCCVDAMADSDHWQRSDKEERSRLLLAILCHDLGKPLCTEFMEKRGKLRWTSHGHDSAGIPLARRFLERIGAFRKVSQAVPPLVGAHHYLNTVVKEGPSKASLRRLARRIAPANLTQLHAVMTADHLGRPPFVSEKQTQRLERFRRSVEELAILDAAPKPILKGRHLIEEGMEPGPAFKGILDDAFEAQLDGAFDDLEGALRWLRKSCRSTQTNDARAN